jgi:hypothetical protein
MAAVEAGPVEVMTLIFPGDRAHPDVADVLADLATGREISVLDLVFVTRPAEGPVRVASVRENLGHTGLGALEISAQALISEDDLKAISESLEPCMSAAMIAYEHRWTRQLVAVVRDAGGTVIFSRPAERQHALDADPEQRAVAASEAAVREAEAEAAAAERAAERYATLGSAPAIGNDLVSQLAYLARLRDSGALSEAEFEAAKARLLAT